MKSETEFVGIVCERKKPTKKHRPAIWEALLGTLKAMNDDGEVKNFDYDWNAAFIFAGVAVGGKRKRDARLWPNRFSHKNGYSAGKYHEAPDPGKLVVWVK